MPRPLYTPGPDFDQRPIPVTRQPRRTWFRVHRAGSPAVRFGIQAHHRFSHPDCPYPLLYLGASLSTCLLEYFGDEVLAGQRVIAASKWNGCRLSRIEVPALRVCAFSHEATRIAMGVDKASLLASDLAVPQAWGLAVQRHPAAFEAIKVSSRFIDQPCLALFERGGMEAQVRETLLGPLHQLDAAVDWLDVHKAALV